MYILEPVKDIKYTRISSRCVGHSGQAKLLQEKHFEQVHRIMSYIIVRVLHTKYWKVLLFPDRKLMN